MVIGGKQFFANIYSASFNIYYFSNCKIVESIDEQVAAIVTKALKEITYHVRWSSEWVIRLGDGTEESHQRMIKAIDELWRYTGEMFMPAEYEKETGIDFDLLKEEWNKKVKDIFDEATLTIPEKVFMQSGGKKGGIQNSLVIS